MNPDQPYPATDAFPNAPGLSKSLGLTQAPAEPFPRFIERDGVKLKWYSICSIHSPRSEPNPSCGMCRNGSYKRQDETGNTW